MAFLILLAFNLRWLPGHHKNDVGPEARSKNLFKKCDHTFQTFAKPRPLNKNRFTRGITINILVCCQYLPIEKYDEGIDLLDLLLQHLHQLLHSLSVSLHIISKAYEKSDCLFLHLIYFMLPGVSITVTGFPSSPFHLDLSIRLLIDLEGNFASFLTFPPQHRSFWSHPEFLPRQQSIGCHQSSPHP